MFRPVSIRVNILTNFMIVIGLIAVSLLGIAIDADVMLKPYHEKILFSLAIAFVFVILTIPLIFYTTSRIVRPIKELMLQNDKIKARHFDEVTPIKTRIAELIDLSDHHLPGWYSFLQTT